MAKSTLAVMPLASLLLIPAAAHAANEAAPVPVDVWEPPFNQQRQHVRKEYTRLAHAAKPWRLCASIPHLKDDYWLAVNYALIQEARRLGVKLNLFEAGDVTAGSPGLARVRFTSANPEFKAWMTVWGST